MATALAAAALFAALGGSPGAGAGLQYQGLTVKSPTSWFHQWFTTPEGSGAGALSVARRPQPQAEQLISPAVRFGYGRYNGPDTWALDSPQCAGGRQSPIDLRSDDMLRLRTRSPLRWEGYWRPGNMTLRNSGHTVQVNGRWHEGAAPMLSGGPLDGEYEFSQLHFHWGPNDRHGSEHTVHNVSFPMEMHAVHFKRDYGDVPTAQDFADGLVVVSYLFQMRGTASNALQPLLRAMGTVRVAGLETPLPPFPLSQLLREFEEDYVMYEGSLTTPPCAESVTWLLSARPLPVSHNQLEAFRSLEGEDGAVDNNLRPVQPSNGRAVYYVDVE